MNISQLRSFLLIPLIIFSILFLLPGCEKKEADKEKPAQTVETQKQETAKVVDVKGKYSGTFDNKAATLNITDQDAATFKGNLTVNYRKALHQDVEGNFDSKTMEFTMKDITAGKFQGSYKGKFSDDFSSLRGTFTLNSKGGSYSFNLKKK